MKNKTVRMIMAVSVLAVLCGAYAGVKTGVARQEQKEQEAKESEEEQSEILFEAAAENIKEVGVQIDGKEVVFEKEDDSWVKQDEKAFPVNQTELDNMITSIESIESDRVLENVEGLEEYGLAEPSNIIRITEKETTEEETEKITETTLKIGDKNTSSNQYYVSKGDDENTVYLVNSPVVEPFMNELYDYAQKEDFPAVSAVDTVSRIAVAGEEIEDYEINKNADTGSWTIRDVEIESNAEPEKADSAKASALASSLGSLSYAAMIDYDCADKGEYGLDLPYAVITADYQEEVPAENADDMEESAENVESEGTDAESAEDTDSEEKEPERIDKQLVITVGDAAENGGRYVLVNESNQVYTMSEESLDAFLGKRKSDFWDLTVNYLSVNRLENLKVAYKNDTHEINVSRETSKNEDGEEVEETTYLLDGKEIEKIDFTTFYNKIINMTGQRRLEEEFEPASEPEMTVEFISDDGTVTKEECYAYDENYYAVVVESKTYLVNKMTVKDMFEAFEKFVAVS